MVAIKRYEYETGILSFRIRKTIKEQHSTKAILKELGEVFVSLADRYTPTEIETLMLNNPLAKAIIEVLPE